MADLPGRSSFEQRMARILGRLLGAQMGRLLELMGDPPSLDNVPADFWDQSGRELQAAIAPMVRDVYLTQAAEVLSDTPLGVEWGTVNTAASEWAASASFDLIRGLNETSRRAVQQAVSRFFTDQQTIGDLREQLTGVFGPVRADMIASTEVTRAAVEGERALIRDLERQGVQFVPTWRTSEDERVCPLCGPRADQAIMDGQYPPIHPRCRCWVTHEPVMTDG